MVDLLTIHGPVREPYLSEFSESYDLDSGCSAESTLLLHLAVGTSLPALIGQAPMGSPFLGGVSAPAGKPHPLFHVGSYLSSNSIDVAKVVVKELQRLWKPRNWNREIPPQHVRVREGSRLAVDRDGGWDGCEME